MKERQMEGRKDKKKEERKLKPRENMQGSVVKYNSAGPSPQRELSYSCCSPVLRRMWLAVLGTLGDMGHFPEFRPHSGN